MKEALVQDTGHLDNMAPIIAQRDPPACIKPCPALRADQDHPVEIPGGFHRALFTVLPGVYADKRGMEPVFVPAGRTDVQFLTRLYRRNLRRNTHILHCSPVGRGEFLTFPFAACRATASIISAAFFLLFTAACSRSNFRGGRASVSAIFCSRISLLTVRPSTAVPASISTILFALFCCSG